MKKLITILASGCFLGISAAVNQLYSTVYFSYDFAGSGDFQFTYGEWSGNTTPGASYITINTGTIGTDGGAGFNLFGVDVTATPAANTYLVVRARLLPTHNGTDIRVSLTTSLTDYSVWSAPAALFNTTTFSTVLIPLSTAPVFVSGSGVDFTNVQTFQLQGNYSGTDDFDIEVESVSLIPEPGNVALAVLLALGSVAFVARKRRELAVW